MIALAAGLVWAGYGLSSYGWCLVKGYNITARSWFTPVGTFQWPDNPGYVPKGQVFPSGAGAGAGAGTAGEGNAGPAAGGSAAEASAGPALA